MCIACWADVLQGTVKVQFQKIRPYEKVTILYYSSLSILFYIWLSSVAGYHESIIRMISNELIDCTKDIRHPSHGANSKQSIFLPQICFYFCFTFRGETFVGRNFLFLLFWPFSRNYIPAKIFRKQIRESFSHAKYSKTIFSFTRARKS